jgi:zinc transport system ATP-binding protein
MHSSDHSPIISISDVSASYDGRTVLEHVSLDIYERDFLGVIGPNGGGKTTLMRIILGLKKADNGTVHYFRDGKECSELTIGYLPQYSHIDQQFPISVYEVILSGLSKQKPLMRPFTRAQHEQVRDTIKQMELEGLEERPIGALSGGQLQRVLLARAIVSRPEVVILDEPNTYIDKRFQAQMYELLKTVNLHCAIVIVSHDVGTVIQNVQSIACVNRTVHYHPSAEVTEEMIEDNTDCPIEILGHGDMPHRILKKHEG